MGKTQLASEFVHRYGQFFLGGVFWLSFADASSIQSQVVECYIATGLDMQLNFGSLPLNDQLRLVLSAWQSPLPRLLIFDNCRDERLLAQWRPPTGGCRIVITSNRTTWAPELEVKTLPLSKLSREESIELLRQYCPNFSNADLGAIANELDDHPLAMSLAGSYLRKYHHTNLANPDTYLKQLRQMTPLQHISLKGKGSTYSPTGHELNVEQTFALNYELLENDDPVDAKSLTLLARAAFFAPGEPIPRNLLRRTVGQADDNPVEELQIEDALERLQTLGLLENQEDGSLRLHRLVVTFIQMRVGTTGTEAQTAVEQVLLVTADDLNSKGYPIPMLALQPHLRLVTNVALERGDKRAANLCTQLGIHLHMIGEYSEAVSYTEQALAIRRKVLEPEDPEIAGSLNNLGELYRAQGKYEQAEPLFEQALAIRRKALGAEHPNLAAGLNNLGELYQLQGKYEQAEPLYQRALAIEEQQLGLEHSDVVATLNNLAMLYYKQGKYTETEPLYQRVLHIQEHRLGPEHLDVAASLNNLAILYHKQGKYTEAKPLYQRTLRLQEQQLGPGHSSTQATRRNYALLPRDDGAR